VTRWLAPTFRPPARLELPSGHHARPIRADDIDLDYEAVMGSQARLFGIFGPAWGWPPADLSRDADLAELDRHAREMETLDSFNYAIFDAEETELLGCIYVDPPEKAGADAEISWWVVDREVGSPLDRALEPTVRDWIASQWPFSAPRFVGPGLDTSWAEYLELPDASGREAAG
jgi:hypothetical protein